MATTLGCGPAQLAPGFVVRCGWRCWCWLAVTFCASFWSAHVWAANGGQISGISFEFAISTIVAIGGALVAGYTRGVDKSVSRVEAAALKKAEELERLTERRASEVLEIHRIAQQQIWHEFNQQQTQINMLRTSDAHPTRHETEAHREFVESKLASLERRLDLLVPAHLHRRADDHPP